MISFQPLASWGPRRSTLWSRLGSTGLPRWTELPVHVTVGRRTSGLRVRISFCSWSRRRSCCCCSCSSRRWSHQGPSSACRPLTFLRRPHLSLSPGDSVAGPVVRGTAPAPLVNGIDPPPLAAPLTRRRPQAILIALAQYSRGTENSGEAKRTRNPVQLEACRRSVSRGGISCTGCGSGAQIPARIAGSCLLHRPRSFPRTTLLGCCLRMPGYGSTRDPGNSGHG